MKTFSMRAAALSAIAVAALGLSACGASTKDDVADSESAAVGDAVATVTIDDQGYADTGNGQRYSFDYTLTSKLDSEASIAISFEAQDADGKELGTTAAVVKDVPAGKSVEESMSFLEIEIDKGDPADIDQVVVVKDSIQEVKS